MGKYLIFNSFFITNLILIFGYEIPKPTLKLLSPKGFRISIPSDPGIVIFAFHGAINRELNGIEPGDFSGEITSPTDGYYIYENQKELLQSGDILYYWIHVQHGNLGYRMTKQSIRLITDANGKFVSRIQDTSTSTSTSKPLLLYPERIKTYPYQTTTANPYIPSLSDRTGLNDESASSEPLSPSSTSNNSNCQRSKTTVKGRKACQGELIFEETFEVLNWTKWQREIKIPLDSQDAEFVSYQDLSQNCYITDGNLHIVPTLLKDVNGYNEDSIRGGEINLGAKCTGIVDSNVECRRKAESYRILPPVVSAKIRTKDHFSFRYGRVDIKAKLPKGDWLFPQLYLEPLTSDYGITGFASGQMRIAFIHGNEILETKDGRNIAGNQLFGGMVLTTGFNYRNNWLYSRSWENHLNTDFHVYSLIWTDQTITLSIDNKDYAVVRGGFKQLYKTHNIENAQQWENGGFMAPFDKEFYLSLGVSVGGIADFPDYCQTGPTRKEKPWLNSDPKAELRFWNDHNVWHETWDGSDAGITIDYVRVWAL